MIYKQPSLSLPPLYHITGLLPSGGSHTELVSLLAAGGATWIQVRDKRPPDAELLAAVSEAAALARARNVTLLVNDWLDVALAAGAAGVHLGQDDLSVEEARRRFPGGIIGLSTHNLRQADAAGRLPVDYIAIGPIFRTATKTENAPLGLEVLRQVRRSVSRPLVAIGGITPENALLAWEAGADSVAVISDIIGSGDPAGRTALYFSLWKQFRA